MAYITIGGNKLGSTPSSAQNFPYDNTSSGLKATSVQGAIDEIGTNFHVIYAGTEEPDDTVGDEGDVYIQL